MLKVADLVARLSDEEQTALYNAIGAGIHDARKAAEYFTDPGAQAQDVVQLLACLSRGIRHLEEAHAVVLRHVT